MEINRKTTNKIAYISGAIGITIGLLLQFGGSLLTEGPLGDVIKKTRNAAPVNTTWEYKEAKDQATGMPIKGAILNSTNTADTGFGPTARMRLILAENNKQKSVAVRSTQGVSLCASSPDKCLVELEFDNGTVEKIKAYYSKQNILLDDSERLFNRIKAAKKLTVGAVYVSSAGKLPCKFNFDTSGLTWNE